LALYFFCFALFLIAVTLTASVALAAYRLVVRVVILRHAEFFLSAHEARPGETIEARAHVVPRWSSTVTVQARLACTMFDHRAHELYASSRTMVAGVPVADDFTAALALPPYALRTGRVGDGFPNPFSEHGRHMLVVWTVEFEVRSAGGKLLHRKSRAFEVPRGRRLKSNLRRMSLLAIDTFSSIRNDMLFNWLVHLAACDGAINPAELKLLHELLDEMSGGMKDREEADTRIERELQRRLVIDDVFLRRYVPLDARLEFYRALYTLALTDGELHQREEKFLGDALKAFGLTEDDVKQVQGEVASERAPDPTS